jgi:1-acyl-sn-glycerol-3-phosphate acyltransferase
MKLEDLPKNISWKRRAVTIPMWLTLAVILPVTLPLVVPILALYDIVTGNRLSATRTMLFFTLFFVLESIGLCIAFWIWVRHLFGLDGRDYEMANRRLQRWWAKGLFWGPLRIFSAEVTIEGLEHLENRRPSVVLSRHASTLDTMLPLAVVRQLKLFRYVIKAELLADPALDYCAQRFPNVFVNRGSDDPEFEVRKVVALGTELEENTAVVVDPGGTRFSAEKRERLPEKFADNPKMLAITESLTHTLPPLREGGVRLVETTPDADVVFVAHRGVDDAAAMSDLIKGGMTEAQLEICIWRYPADEVPRTTEAVEDFLVENWKRIDRFVADGFDAEEEPATGHKRAG